MENNPSKDVYDLIANLIKTSDEISSGKSEVVLSSKSETNTTSNLSESDEPKEKKSTNIKIVDNGFINLSRLVTEQKDLMEKLQTKISEFEKEVEIEGAKKSKEPVTIQELKDELAAFTTNYNNQFNFKIKTIEDNLQERLNKLEFVVTQPKEEKKFPTWLLWLNMFLILLNSLLLLWNLYTINKKPASTPTEEIQINTSASPTGDTASAIEATPSDTIVNTPNTETNSTPSTEKTEETKTASVQKSISSQELPLQEPSINKTSAVEQGVAISKPSSEPDTIGQSKDVFFGDD